MTTPTTPVLPHRKSIDGLRGLAVSAVLLYHAEVSWIPGGFLGVDVFFAISGYLITSLLLVEVAVGNGVGLRAFWLRRARRLLPAVGVLLVGVTLAALVGAHDAIGRLRGDVGAALTYSSNWWQIARGETYFETFGRPPLLRHLWSLAVEEQLYIVLPLVVAFLAKRGWMQHRRRIAAVALGGALGSTLLLHATWRAADPSRAWFGTDTRAAALLVGVAFALLWPMAERQRWSGIGRGFIETTAMGSIAALGLLMVTLGDRDGALHRWGFGLTALLAGAAVVAATSPSCRSARVLSLRPLQWIGLRSYAIYLWHWPVFVLTRPELDVAIDGWRLLAVRLLITGLLAELSWRLVEQPFRTGTIGRSWRALRRGVRVRIAIAGATVVAVLGAALAVGLSSAAVTEMPELLATVSQSPTTETTLVRITTTTRPRSTTTSMIMPATTASPAPTAPTTTLPPPPPPPGAVLAVGDSVMLAARDALVSASGGRVYVDAAIGRQVNAGLLLLQQYKDQGTFSQVSALVIHLGTNGAMSDDLFNQLATIVEGVPRVVLLNVRVPKSWEGQSNAAINGGVTRFEFMRLADWHSGSMEPGAVGDDGVHPSRTGARIYSDLVLRQLEGAPPPTTTTTTTPPPPTTTTTSTTTPPPVATTPPPEPTTTTTSSPPAAPVPTG